MSLVLPSTVEELNCMQNSLEFQSVQHMYIKDSSKDFPNINAGRYKREYSLPNGTHDFDLQDFEPYLTFDDTPNNYEVIKSHEDRLVPGEEQRQRSESFSSVASSMDDKSLVYHNMAVKTFNTVCMDSGSTCISSEHSYVTPSVFKDLESEETFQNLHPYLTQGPEMHTTDTTSSISSASSPLNESLEFSVLSNFSMISNNSNDSFSEKSVSLKRSTASPDDFFVMSPSKRLCESPDANRYLEVRKKNNIASKNCRKTRKEKQKEMDVRVVDLEKEREDLKRKITYLETMTNVYKKHIEAILKPRRNV